ncbi:N-acetylmuramoyl-L-alanine amidase [Zooshikella ganghwensis]|uniref:N-acetylmuramoyl-L-alanine amidase n=1 Tax=Zooshikella ganghwensis TaxID=202772 RepID=A0A4P9VIQ5_9GAMM|nr:N-acetylmuramoyl-L-alanine amidase [Zooshikella ganghwensis]RDH41562.1 N-acetylmuramoyl-L-alanine amidase [Zooshikella ganghwensis]
MKITRLVVHCSDTPNDRDVTAADIHRWHKERKWSGIGYHKVIRRDGTVENGRPEYWKGAHVKGYNSKSLGVCLIGRDEFTADQFDSLDRVLTRWKDKYPLAEICGHRDLDPHKSCPNFDVGEWWDSNIVSSR